MKVSSFLGPIFSNSLYHSFTKIFIWSVWDRYEYQKDNSVLGEDRFAYDSDWLKSQIMSCLEFWLGEREANCTPKEERWKCWFCQYSSICPTNTNPDSTQGLITDNLNSTPS